MILHFILTENRPILLLYFAYRSYLLDLIFYDVTHSFLTWNNEVLRDISNATQSEENIGHYFDCLTDDVESSILTFNRTHDHAHVGPYHHGALHRGPPRLGLEQRRAHNTLVGEFRQGHHHKVIEFLETYGTDALVLLYSAVKLFSTTEPSFAWDSEEFRSLQFQRGWSSVFGATNDDFCVALELALYKAGYGAADDLEAMRDKDQTSLRSIMQVCAPVMDSDMEMVGYEQGEGAFAKLPVDSRQVGQIQPPQARQNPEVDSD
eukprot:CAMPEP_0115501598 /NCGR_PEP_ID=MMETSP0271-20121206/68479_1 /TAXON_ID=71861 /ORGANISM="Scrippsiella trochoidea, Strain CCMP3099" /LENGTH=262 /DNA_ID=CAMNT_0002930535 /DNA_START=83 /DNA_END=868 /DNA_ORIENTATION=+